MNPALPLVLLALPLTPATTLFRSATLVDSTAPAPRPGMALLVRDGRILKVVPDAQAEALRGPGVQVVDLHGRFLMPGLVDTHVHLATTPDLAVVKDLATFLLMGGVTTMRDMAGDARTLAEARRSLLVGAWTGPSLYYSALMAGPRFFVDERTHASSCGETAGKVAWMAGIGPDTDLVTAVAQAKGTYASGIKLYANLDAGTTARIVAEARRQSFPVWAHAALFPARPSDVVATGLASVSHAPMFVYEVAPMPDERLAQRPKPDYAGVSPEDPLIQAVFRTMKAKGVALDATMTVFRIPRSHKPEDRARAKEEYAFAVRVTRGAHLAGVTVTTGTDALGTYRTGEPAIWAELAALQEDAGFTPAEVLAAATSNGARTLGLESQQGTLEPGQRADFVVLRKNPLQDIRAIRTLQATIIGGKLVRRAGYRPSTRIRKELQ